MSNRGPKLHKKDKPRKKADKTKKEKLRFLSWFVVAATLLGGIVAGLAFVPRISISPGDPTDPSNPFSATFTIINTTVIPVPIYHVGARVIYGLVTSGTVPSNPEREFPLGSGGFSRPEWQDHTLRIDERFTISPEGIVGMGGRGTPHETPLGGADIAIVVKYKPWLIPIERESSFRFMTKRHGNGSISWYSVPLDSPY